MSDQTPPAMEPSDSGAFGTLSRPLAPIPDKPKAQEETPEEQPPDETPEEEAPEEEGFSFGDRKWKDQKAAERAFKGVAGKLKQYQAQEHEVREQFDEMQAEIRALRAAQRVGTQEAQPQKPLPKAEWQDFVSRMTDKDWAQFDADLERDGEKVANARLHQKAETYYREQFQSLRQEMAELKRQTIEEPARDAQDVRDYGEAVSALFIGAENYIDAEGNAPLSWIYQSGDNKEIVQNLDAIHQVMLTNRMDPTPAAFYTAACAYYGHEALMGRNGQKNGEARVPKRGPQPRRDPTLGVDDGGSPPVRRQEKVDLIAGSSPRMDTAFGKLAR